MVELQKKIVDILRKNNIDIVNNRSLAIDINNLVSEFSNGKDIEIAKSQIFTKDSLKKGCKCPVCEQNVKMYWKKIDSLMAYYLIQLYKISVSNPNRDYFHVEDDIKVPLKVGGSWAKLRWWGLIEEKKKDGTPINSRTSGYWMITDKGKDFVRGNIKLPTYVKLYNAHYYGVDGQEIGISKCLTSKFNYIELMNSPL